MVVKNSKPNIFAQLEQAQRQLDPHYYDTLQEKKLATPDVYAQADAFLQKFREKKSFISEKFHAGEPVFISVGRTLPDGKKTTDIYKGIVADRDEQGDVFVAYTDIDGAQKEIQVNADLLYAWQQELPSASDIASKQELEAVAFGAELRDAQIEEAVEMAESRAEPVWVPIGNVYKKQGLILGHDFDQDIITYRTVDMDQQGNFLPRMRNMTRAQFFAYQEAGKASLHVNQTPKVTDDVHSALQDVFAIGAQEKEKQRLKTQNISLPPPLPTKTRQAPPVPENMRQTLAQRKSDFPEIVDALSKPMDLGTTVLQQRTETRNAPATPTPGPRSYYDSIRPSIEVNLPTPQVSQMGSSVTNWQRSAAVESARPAQSQHPKNQKPPKKPGFFARLFGKK